MAVSKNLVDIFLIDPEGPELRIPVNPTEITIRREKEMDTVSIVNIGEVDFGTGYKRPEISFSSFFPRDYDSSYCQYIDIPDPQEAMQQLTKWTMSKKPIRLMITTTEVNVLILLTAHTSYFRGGEPGDVYFDIVCRPWREIKVWTTEEDAPTGIPGIPPAQQRPDTKPVPSTLEIKPGDSLWAIAKAQLGDGSKWKDIYEANKDAIGPNPDMINPGTQLVMPA